ncbi:MAG TPA: lipopolysaccharide kinase InaA family protein [Tepidisphaeraceae bacterium]|jgi:heptose I phosphotransferase
MRETGSSFRIAPQYQSLMREVGLDADTVFDHPEIRVWRSIPERENCTLDADWQGRKIRLHIKRYRTSEEKHSPADQEAGAIQALMGAEIPTVSLVGWGQLADGRSFVITGDLAGYEPADKLIERGLPFDQVRDATADLAGRLHNRGLHHRDLYLCHFFVKADDPTDVRLIDAARVGKLTNFFTRQRWIRKDLAQFWYSTMALPISDEQRLAWLQRYAEQRGMPSPAPLVKGIERKAAWIARHDEKLREKQPGRNVSIPRDLA